MSGVPQTAAARAAGEKAPAEAVATKEQAEAIAGYDLWGRFDED